MFISHNPEETIALGEIWGREAVDGWIIGLSGDLGAGKTQLVKGLARGLGVAEIVRSPSFVLVHEYRDGRIPLRHLDFYRLQSRREIEDAGLAEYLIQPAGLTAVEWVERWFEQLPVTGGHLPTRFRHVRFETLGATARGIKYEDFDA